MNIILQTLLYLLSVTSAPLPMGDKLPGKTYKENKIIVELRLGPKELKDSGKVSFQPVEYILNPKTNSEFKRPQNGLLQIEMTSKEPVYLNFIDLLRASKGGYYLTEPGDEVVITSNGNGFGFSGKGAEKYRLQYQLDSLVKSIPKANNKTGLNVFYLDSYEEYFALTRYYQQKINLGMPLINSYKGKISDWAFSNITDSYVRSAIKSLRDNFYSLMEHGVSRQKVSTKNLVQIYDTSYAKATQEWLGYATNKQLIALEIKVHQVQRAFSFDSLRMPTSDEILLNQLDEIVTIHKGQELERLVVNRLPKTMIKYGFTPAIEKILANYYANSTYPEWKAWIKEQELLTRLSWLSYRSPDFTLTDAKGKQLTNKDLKGKIAVLYFQDKEGTDLKKAIEKYKNHPGVVFVNISTEKFRSAWKNNIGNVVYANAGSSDAAHSIFKDYAVQSLPCIWVMDSLGKVLNSSPLVNLTNDKGEKLAAFIQKKIDKDNTLHQKMLSIKKDGPYIFHDGDVTTSYSVDDTTVARTYINKFKPQQLAVQTDLEKAFSVNLQSAITIQPSVYAAAEKLLAFSDIEGNFDAFRKLLQSNKVIDDNFNWVFGNGHLVFAGDMFDRGMQVTECLWLMYSLEEKAKAAGGYVHFVLGNHEIMNMQGNHNYTTGKYKKNARLIGKTITQLYNENSELGRWLRTKNIMEKIGDLLFVHGGISPEINRLPLGIEEINNLARPYYASKLDSTNKELLTVYDPRHGERYRISPFWSRGYYKGRNTKGIDKISDEQLDSTLNKFNVSRVVTGHTIVADTISVHYGTRVINTDTKHAKGLSEAFLMEGNRYYRVNDKGDKVFLFSDDRIKRN